MWYPIHENTFCQSSARYTVDWYFVTEEVWIPIGWNRNHTAMGYPIFNNALCHSLTSYLLSWSIVTEPNRIRNDMTSFISMCRLLPTPPPPRAKVHYELCHSALHHSVLYDMLYTINCHNLCLHFIVYLLLCSAKIFILYVPFTFCYVKDWPKFSNSHVWLLINFFFCMLFFIHL